MTMYNRQQIETSIIGTMLNDFGSDGFYQQNKMVLREDMFDDVRCRFVFGVIARMNEEGLRQTTPADVLAYCDGHGIAYGDTKAFAVFMADAIEIYAWKSFGEYVRQLVKFYIERKRREQQL